MGMKLTHGDILFCRVLQRRKRRYTHLQYQEDGLWQDYKIRLSILGMATANSSVKRLRSVLPRAYQLSNDFKRPAGITGDRSNEFMQYLHAEPCVVECDQDVQEMMEVPDKLRKEMAPRKLSVPAKIICWQRLTQT